MNTLILITTLIIPLCIYTQNGNEILSEEFYLTYKLKYKLKDSEKKKYIDTDKFFEDTDIKNRIQFTGDSIISVSYNLIGLQSFNLGSVNSISFYDGRYILEGMMYGALSGCALPLLFGAIYLIFGDNTENQYDMLGKSLGVIVVAITTSAGLLIGGIAGALTKSYDEYKLNRYKDNKAQKEAILRLAKKYKPRL